MAPTHKLFASLVIGASILGGAALGGCSNSMTKEEFKADFTAQIKDDPQMKSNPQLQAVMTDKTISCIVDELDKKSFKFRKRGEATAEENAQVEAASTKCVTEAASQISIPPSGS